MEKHDVRAEHSVSDAFGISQTMKRACLQQCRTVLNFEIFVVGGARSVVPGFWRTLPLGGLELVSKQPNLRLTLNRKRKSRPGPGLRRFLDVIAHSSLITPKGFKLEYPSTLHI